MTRAEIKADARAQLSRNIFGNSWMTALLVCLLADAITVAAGTILPGFGAMIVVGPLSFGIAAMFRKQSFDHDTMNIGDVFKGFTTDFGQTFLLGLLTSIFIALWSLLLVIPGIVKYYSYSMCYYIKADHPDYEWRQCIRGSQELMNGHKGELFMLDLSFLGWYIVGAICFGIGTLWVIPYHEAARAVFYKNLQSPALSASYYVESNGGNGWYQD